VSFETRFERLELKYLIDERTASRVRSQIAPLCHRDPHGDASGNGCRIGSYPVQSLYLDTPSLAFHRAKERGESERIKLRIRGYRGLRAASLELKRRTGDIVEKTRTLVAEADLRESARGVAKPLQDHPAAHAFVERFGRLALTTGAEPTMLVRYQREAYSSDVDAYARVTFDRDVEYQLCTDWSLEGEAGAWFDLERHLYPGAPRPLVILELKCETMVPAWIVEVVRRNRLRRASVCKYSLGVYAGRREQGLERLPERARGVFR
jgi:hypothetical protein